MLQTFWQASMQRPKRGYGNMMSQRRKKYWRVERGINSKSQIFRCSALRHIRRRPGTIHGFTEGDLRHRRVGRLLRRAACVSVQRGASEELNEKGQDSQLFR